MRSSRSGRTEPAQAIARRLDCLIERPFAHRGLHGGGLIENSRPAFEAAIAAQMGIELDVQLSRDGIAIVFHDEQLGRLTDRQDRLDALSAAEIMTIPYKGTSETIATLAEALAMIAGRAPLLVEVKAPGHDVRALAAAVLGDVRHYEGPVAIMSFNPQVGAWFAAHAPDLLRGLVVTEAGRRWRGTVARRLALWRARPDFLAYDIRDLPSPFASRQRRLGMKILTWTCRSDDDFAVAGRYADQIIHERARLSPEPS